MQCTALAVQLRGGLSAAHERAGKAAPHQGQTGNDGGQALLHRRPIGESCASSGPSCM